jgi:hypothetical protein
MKSLIMFVLISFSSIAFSDVYKCKLGTGDVKYQAEPCSPVAVKQKVIPIKPQDPVEASKAAMRFSAWQEEQAKQEKIAQLQEKQRQADLEKQNLQEAYMRAVIAQQQAATVPTQPPVVINQYIPTSDDMMRKILSEQRWQDLHQEIRFDSSSP